MSQRRTKRPYRPNEAEDAGPDPEQSEKPERKGVRAFDGDPDSLTERAPLPAIRQLTESEVEAIARKFPAQWASWGKMISAADAAGAAARKAEGNRDLDQTPRAGYLLNDVHLLWEQVWRRAEAGWEKLGEGFFGAGALVEGLVA